VLIAAVHLDLNVESDFFFHSFCIIVHYNCLWVEWPNRVV